MLVNTPKDIIYLCIFNTVDKEYRASRHFYYHIFCVLLLKYFSSYSLVFSHKSSKRSAVKLKTV